MLFIEPLFNTFQGCIFCIILFFFQAAKNALSYFKFYSLFHYVHYTNSWANVFSKLNFFFSLSPPHIFNPLPPPPAGEPMKNIQYTPLINFNNLFFYHRNRDAETELMKDVEGWEVGTWYGHKVYKVTYFLVVMLLPSSLCLFRGLKCSSLVCKDKGIVLWSVFKELRYLE